MAHGGSPLRYVEARERSPPPALASVAYPRAGERGRSATPAKPRGAKRCGHRPVPHRTHRPTRETPPFVVPPASGGGGFGTKMAMFALAQSSQPHVRWRARKHDEIEGGYDRGTPAIERPGHDPVGPIEKHVARQSETLGARPLLAIERLRRAPEVVVDIVIRECQRVRERATEGRSR